MFRSAIICPDVELTNQLHRALHDIGSLSVVRMMDRYPNATELTRFVRAHAPQIIFLSAESVSQALVVMNQLEQVTAGIQVIAVHRAVDPQMLIELMRAGVREFLALPFERRLLIEALARVAEQLEKKPVGFESSDMVFSFLPAKAGVGTSTIALNTAVALAKIDSTSTLLSDFDLNSGMIRFLLKLENSHSVTDAAEHAMEMDENLWPQLVTSIGSLDVLHAGRLNPNFRIESSQIRHLLDFMRRNYRAICLDLSGNLERYSVEIMHESKRVFLVCTPEISSLHLAREKFQYLQQLELTDRVAVLLNRCQKRPLISPEDVERLLGIPVHMTFPNDYQCVQRALTAGKPVESSSDFGRQCSVLAHAMLDRKPTVVSETKRRFVEYFTINPSRYSFEAKKQ